MLKPLTLMSFKTPSKKISIFKSIELQGARMNMEDRQVYGTHNSTNWSLENDDVSPERKFEIENDINLYNFIYSAVFDGHSSSNCAEFLAKNMPTILFNNLEHTIHDENHILNVFRKTIHELDELWTDFSVSHFSDYSGSTITFTIVNLDTRLAYNLTMGDSNTAIYDEHGEIINCLISTYDFAIENCLANKSEFFKSYPDIKSFLQTKLETSYETPAPGVTLEQRIPGLPNFKGIPSSKIDYLKLGEEFHNLSIIHDDPEQTGLTNYLLWNINDRTNITDNWIIPIVDKSNSIRMGHSGLNVARSFGDLTRWVSPRRKLSIAINNGTLYTFKLPFTKITIVNKCDGFIDHNVLSDTDFGRLLYSDITLNKLLNSISRDNHFIKTIIKWKGKPGILGNILKKYPDICSEPIPEQLHYLNNIFKCYGHSSYCDRHQSCEYLSGITTERKIIPECENCHWNSIYSKSIHFILEYIKKDIDLTTITIQERLELCAHYAILRGSSDNLSTNATIIAPPSTYPIEHYFHKIKPRL